MRTYKRSAHASEHAKKRMSKKGIYAVAVTASVLLVALALTLSLTFGLRTPAPADNDYKPADNPIEPPAKIVFGAPLSQCTVVKEAALNRLVYNETLKQWRTHNGVDFEAAAGSDVLSVADGTVTNVENTILEGVVVTVTHDDGYVSVYKGLESASVQKDDTVEAGGKLGVVGTMMCEQKSGAHLHLEMKKNGKYISATDIISIENDK